MRDEAFLAAAWWPLASLGEGLEALARRHGLLPADAGGRLDGPTPEAGPEAGPGLTEWLHWAGAALGIETVEAQTAARDLRQVLTRGAPAIVMLPWRGAPGFLALTGQRRGTPVFLTAAGQGVRVDSATAEALLIRDMVAPLAPEIRRVLDAAGIPAARRGPVGQAIAAERIANEPVRGVILLRLPASASSAGQVRAAGLPLRLLQIVALFVLLYGGEVWGWQLIGGATIDGRLDHGWLAAWGLLAFTLLPGRLLAGWIETLFTLDFSRLLKARLLAGALALAPDVVRRRGVGGLIGQVMEAQALEGAALAGAFALLVGTIELAFAGWVLSLGAAPLLHPLLLGGLAVLVTGLGLRSARRIGTWTAARLGLTGYLVEAMIGHRTRLAQERPQRRDAAEDSLLAGYHGTAARMDRAALQLGAAPALVWNLLALAALGPALAGGPPPSPALLAISIGGIMLGQRALAGMAAGLASLSRARFAWGQVATLFRAAAHPPMPGLPAIPRGTGPVLEAQGLVFGHEGAGTPVLDRVDLSIARGDRILVEGPSGGGKSTLAGVLTGLRPAAQGLLLVDGLDRPTLGDGWHDRITAAPQFHDNHVLSGTLAFNLLMGRSWPPSEADLAEAAEVCEELGLGDLLRRMPGGLNQRIGETGWQLSHGERSRVFLARALLQRAAVTILDESFASLDPPTMSQCLDTALKRAETLVVIAHP